MTKLKTVSVTLIKAHTHKGEQYQPDDKITVTEDQRQWLLDRQIIAAPPVN